jgi:hypothetical protein
MGVHLSLLYAGLLTERQILHVRYHMWNLDLKKRHEHKKGGLFRDGNQWEEGE